MKTKLARLIWSPSNPLGIFRIQPYIIDLAACANYGHFHCLLETEDRPEMVKKLLREDGFELVLGGRKVNGKYVGVEADVCGVANLLERVSFLNRINGVRVAAALYYQEISLTMVG